MRWRTGSAPSIDYWLSVTSRHKSMWTSTISVDAQDHDIQRIIEQADDVAADRMLEALSLDDHPQRDRLHAMFLAFGGMARAAGRQWLVRSTLKPRRSRRIAHPIHC